MNTKYQLILLGGNNPFRKRILTLINRRLMELGIDKDAFKCIDADHFDEFQGHGPATCLYFVGELGLNEALVQEVRSKGRIVIPVYNRKTGYSGSVTETLRPLNSFVLNRANAAEAVPALVSRILEILGLLRRTRRVFISYRRNEARAVALQLYNSLDEKGFNIFLDTHSIRSGEVFQDELWHNLVDSDIMLLLNTKGFVGNKWTDAELAKASDMSIGIVQLVWPDSNTDKFYARTSLATPVYLEGTNFTLGVYTGKACRLKRSVLKTIEQEVESLRARALSARQTNLIQEFLKVAARNGCTAVLESDNVIVATRKGADYSVVPVVGVPDAYSAYQREQIVTSAKTRKATEIWILFDQRLILQDYLAFVKWLSPLSVKFLQFADSDNWFKLA